jgi:phage-related protein
MFKLYFYQTSSKREVIADFILSFSKLEITKINNDLNQLSEFGLQLVATPLVKKIYQNPALYELRMKTTREIRLIFCFCKPNVFVILYGFVKKTNKLPKRELDTAIKRAREFI